MGTLTFRLAFLSVAALAIGGCSGGLSKFAPAAPAGPAISAPAAQPAFAAHTSKLVVTPSTLNLLAIGPGGVKTATVSEAAYQGAFTQTSTCTGKANATPATGNGPALKISITGVKAGTCAFTFEDAKKNKAILNVVVTTTTLKLAGPLPSAATAAVKITPPGTTATVAVPACATSAGCSIAVQAAPGTDAFAVSIADASKRTLAIGVAASAAVKPGVANVVPIGFVKTIASLAWGTIPAAAAGTAFPAGGKAVAVTAKDADGNTVTGTYAHPILVTDGDVSGGSSLTVNGGSAAPGLAKSTDALALAYTGLAIAPATLTASSSGVAAQKATFAPVLAPIVYAGPTATPPPHVPEIDLYSSTKGSAGSSGTFTAAQKGWTGTFGKAFSVTFAGIDLQADDCPGSANPAFAVTQTPGPANSAFTVAISNALSQSSNPGNFAGECMMTLKGGGAKTQQVVLTFTSSGVVIGAGHRRLP